jgi:hypothetical protein
MDPYFTRLLGRLRDRGYRAIVSELKIEIRRLKHRPYKDPLTAFLGSDKRLFDWLCTGILPEFIADDERAVYREIAAQLVARGEMSRAVLEFIEADTVAPPAPAEGWLVAKPMGVDRSSRLKHPARR